MGVIYDRAIEVTAAGRVNFRIFWDAQEHMRREGEALAEWDNQATKEHGPEIIGTARENYCELPGCEGLQHAEMRKFNETRCGEEVVFQIVYNGYCEEWEYTTKTPEETRFREYYSFPAGTLDG